MSQPKIQRRNFLQSVTAGLGASGWKALATGLPAGCFGAMSLTALDLRAQGSNAKSLLLFTTHQGEPVNCNAPGTYDVDGIGHPPGEAMAETPLSLGGVTTSAAAPWATLPQWALDRMTVIHHRTYQNSHAQHGKVMGLVGSARGPGGLGTASLPGIIASELASSLGTVQRAPIRFSKAGFTFEGRPVQRLLPSTLAKVFAPKADPMGLAAIRSSALDDIYSMVKERGTPSQIALIDQFAISRAQAENLDRSLSERFAQIEGNEQDDQLDAAVTLLLMNLAPVVVVTLSFGDDNHADPGFEKESLDTASGMVSLATFLTKLEAAGLRDRVVVGNLDVFGRDLVHKPGGGRDHNPNHHAMMIIGDGVKPGVVGTLAPVGSDFGATAIDSSTGQGGDNGDIPEDETLEAAAKTLASACGVPEATLDERIVGGKVIRAAI